MNDQDKFFETKIRLMMKLRGMCRQEAIQEVFRMADEQRKRAERQREIEKMRRRQFRELWMKLADE